MIAIFLFYNKSLGKQQTWACSRTYKHVDVITYMGDRWVLHRLGEHGITYRITTYRSSEELLTNVTSIKTLVYILAIKVNGKAAHPWQPIWAKSCAEVVKSIAGLDIGLTLTPSQLLRKLLKYDNVRNYQILTARRRLYGCEWRQIR